MSIAPFATIKNLAGQLQQKFGKAPRVACVLGSGLSTYSENFKDPARSLFSQFEHLVPSNVEGHRGEALVVTLANGERAFIAAGRIHLFEGHAPEVAVRLVRALKYWGVQKLVLTNATGSTRKTLIPGSLVLIKDQINFTGLSALVGSEQFGGTRFPDVSDLYNQSIRGQIKKIASKLKVPIKEGVYIGTLGPAYETAAEIRMMGKLGADIVGMSTVNEALAFHQMGGQVAGISCVTNLGTGLSKQKLGHGEVLETTQKANVRFSKLLTGVLEYLSKESGS